MGTPTDQQTIALPPVVEAVRARVDAVPERELRDRRGELAALDPAAAVLVEELQRLVGAGGKRLRPAFCYLGHRAAGGTDGGVLPIAPPTPSPLVSFLSLQIIMEPIHRANT